MKLPDEDFCFLLEHAAIRRYRHGRLLFERGDEGTCAFLILGGKVELFIEDRHSRTVITRKENGELFGMLALLGRQGRTAPAMTLEDSRLGVIGKFAFERCLSERPELRAAIFRDLTATIGELTLRLSTVSLDAYGRLRFCLSRLAGEADGAIEGSWTRQQLAELAGCRREKVARIISELKRGQWISCDKKRLVVLRPLPERF